MSNIGLRPRFQVHVDRSPRVVLDAIKGNLAASTSVLGAVYKSSAVLKVPLSARHYWSPELQIAVDGTPQSESGSIIRGMYGPRPSVWSMFIALYVFLTFAGVMGGIFALSQLMIGQRSLMLWSVPGSLLGCAIVYGIARAGRVIGRDQMDELRSFLDGVVETFSESSETE